MATSLKLRRGTTTAHGSFTGAEAEVTVDTTKDTVVVHDGSTAGGFPLLREDLANNTNVTTNTNTQTITNKTISVDNNTVSGIAASSFVLSNSSGNIDGTVAQKAIPSGEVVGTTDSQTITNKTISVDNNTISGISASSFVLSNSSGNLDGSASQKAIPTGDVVGTSDSQTLSNKTLSAPSISGNLTFTGTGNRITGDFSNATIANQVLFQTSTTNDNTQLRAIPNGTGTQSGFFFYDSSNTTNNAWGAIRTVAGLDVRLQSSISGTGSYLPMTFYTGGSERMRIDTSGNVGIGTSSPSYKLDVAGQIASQDAYLITANSSGTPSAGAFIFRPASNTIALGTASTERMRIDSSGSVLAGTTSALASNIHSFVSGGATPLALRNSASTAGRFWYVGPDSAANYLVYNNSSVGMYMAYGGTSWTSTSDERLKENLTPISDAINKVSTLRAVTGNFISDKTKTSRSFLIAQDVQKVLPEAVHTQNDEIGTLGIAYTDTIPLLVAAIQELSAKVDTLQAELNTLKGN